MHVRRFEKTDDLALLADSFNELSGGVPFRRWEWLSTWWRYFLPQKPHSKLDRRREHHAPVVIQRGKRFVQKP